MDDAMGLSVEKLKQIHDEGTAQHQGWKDALLRLQIETVRSCLMTAEVSIDIDSCRARLRDMLSRMSDGLK